MKVMAINGSPHKNGCTYTAMRMVTDELEKEGIEVEFIHVGDQVIRGCIDCGGCRKSENHECAYDDIVNVCIEKSKDVDGILIGTPVYYSGISGTMKSFLDRFFFAGPYLKYKVGASLVSLRRSGAVETFDQLNHYYNLRHIVIAPSRYWNAVHGMKPEQVMQDKEGVEIMHTLGKNMAWLLKVMEYSKDNVALPTED